jgi:hypothetical protein
VDGAFKRYSKMILIGEDGVEIGCKLMEVELIKNGL